MIDANRQYLVVRHRDRVRRRRGATGGGCARSRLGHPARGRGRGGRGDAPVLRLQAATGPRRARVSRCDTFRLLRPQRRRAAGRGPVCGGAATRALVLAAIGAGSRAGRPTCCRTCSRTAHVSQGRRPLGAGSFRVPARTAAVALPARRPRRGGLECGGAGGVRARPPSQRRGANTTAATARSARIRSRLPIASSSSGGNSRSRRDLRRRDQLRRPQAPTVASRAIRRSAGRPATGAAAEASAGRRSSSRREPRTDAASRRR